MKNKKLLYVLIPLTLLIWGLIVYKIVATANPGNESQTINTKFVKNETTENLNDVFSINLNYLDPFLGKDVKISPSTKTASSKTNVNSVKNSPVINTWPSIVYLGIIKNQKSNKQLTLVQINEQSYNMKIGESINSIELTKVFKDSIELKFGKEKKYFHK